MTASSKSLTPEEILASLAGDESVDSCATRWLEAGGESGLAEAIEAAAEALHRGAMRDVAQANRSGARLVELADRAGAVAPRIAARLALGIAQTYGNAFDLALMTFDDAARIEPTESSTRTSAAREAIDVLWARVGLARVHPLARLGRLDEAARVGQEAVTTLVLLGATEFAARGHANLGVIERMRQRPENAIERFRAALASWGPDPVARAQLTSNLAEAFLDLGRFTEAEAAFRSALAALETAKVPHAAAIVEGNLADLLSRQGRLSEALEHYERVRQRHLSIDARGDAARLQAEEAEALAQTGLLGEAVAEYRAALDELERSGLRLEAFRARLGLARALGRLGRFDEAARTLDGLDRALDAATIAPGSPHEGALRVALGELALAVGDARKAHTELSAAVPLLAPRPIEQAVARARLAAAALACGDVPEARRQIDESLSVARGHLLRPLEAELMHGAARCARAEGDERGEMAALRASVALVERVRGTLQASRLRSAFVAGNASAAGDLLQSLVRRGGREELVEAIEVAEGLRGRGLLEAIAGAVPIDALGSEGEGTDGDSDLVREAATLRHEANALFSRLDRQPDVVMNEEWRDAVLAVESRQRLVESRLGARDHVRGAVPAPLSEAEIERVIASDVAHVITCVAGSRMTAIVCRAGEIRAADLGDASSIAERVERCRFQVHRSLLASGERAKRVEQDLLGELGSLGDIVLAPFVDLLRDAPSIQAIPSGPLHALPFGLLPIAGAHLVESGPVASMPSLALSLALSTPRPSTSRPRDVVVVGVADDAAPSIALEARSLAARAADSVLLLGAEATADAVRRASQNAAILHCATHGRFIAESPLRSGILLADGWLTVTDLYRWRLPGTTVVVSGCDTGRVAVEGGDEVAGLQRGFFAAGASSVVLSAWLAHDGATLDLMTAFHERLGTRAGIPDSDAEIGVADALRSAMLAIRRARPRLVEWGAFGVVGSVLPPAM